MNKSTVQIKKEIIDYVYEEIKKEYPAITKVEIKAIIKHFEYKMSYWIKRGKPIELKHLCTLSVIKYRNVKTKYKIDYNKQYMRKRLEESLNLNK